MFPMFTSSKVPYAPGGFKDKFFPFLHEFTMNVHYANTLFCTLLFFCNLLSKVRTDVKDVSKILAAHFRVLGSGFRI